MQIMEKGMVRHTMILSAFSVHSGVYVDISLLGVLFYIFYMAQCVDITHSTCNLIYFIEVNILCV